jgi:hypothetical protein
VGYITQQFRSPEVFSCLGHLLVKQLSYDAASTQRRRLLRTHVTCRVHKQPLARQQQQRGSACNVVWRWQQGWQ